MAAQLFSWILVDSMYCCSSVLHDQVDKHTYVIPALPLYLWVIPCTFLVLRVCRYFKVFGSNDTPKLWYQQVADVFLDMFIAQRLAGIGALFKYTDQNGSSGLSNYILPCSLIALCCLASNFFWIFIGARWPPQHRDLTPISLLGILHPTIIKSVHWLHLVERWETWGLLCSFSAVAVRVLHQWFCFL